MKRWINDSLQDQIRYASTVLNHIVLIININTGAEAFYN